MNNFIVNIFFVYLNKINLNSITNIIQMDTLQKKTEMLKNQNINMIIQPSSSSNDHSEIQVQPINNKGQSSQENSSTAVIKYKRRYRFFVSFLAIFVLIAFVFNGQLFYLRFVRGRDQQKNDFNTSQRPNPNKSTKIITTFKQSSTTTANKSQRIPTINQKSIKSVQQRVQMGQPVIQQPKLVAWTISNQKQTKLCSIINGITSITQSSLKTIQNLLQTRVIGKIILYSKQSNQQKINSLLQKPNTSQHYQISSKIINSIDISYNFIIEQLSNNCQKVLYLSSNMIINQQNLQALVQVLDTLALDVVGFSNKYTQYLSKDRQGAQYKQQPIQLPDLNSTNLQDIPPELYAKYVYYFDAEYLHYITPLNFAYYIKYSLEQMIILPILATVQSTDKLINLNNITGNNQIFYGMPGNSFTNLPVYPLHEHSIKKQNANCAVLCFVSYTSNPYQINQQEVYSYLDSIANLNSTCLSVLAIVYVPYSYSKMDNQIFRVYDRIRQYGQNFEIKLRVRANKTLSTHAVYQSAYTYCPKQSLMISSRHNINFYPQFGQQLSKSITQKYNYYHTNYLEPTLQPNILATVPKYNNRYQVRKSNLFKQRFRHVQIYKNQLMRTNTFWVLKNSQLDFYETQAAFFILMMETVRLQFQYINKTLYEVTQRQYTNTEEQQIQVLKKYVEYSESKALTPYNYNCLQNKAYRRFAPNLLPKIIHQVWFGKDKISDIRMHLHRTVKQVNPNFDVYLWRTENITKEVFPLTYSAMQKTIQYNKHSPKSFIALAADFFRYEAIYNFGGIYVDFKMEALKPVDEFLKYQSFFLDAGNGNQRFGNVMAVGIGVLGATQNNYNLKLMLTEILDLTNINFQSKRISEVTGGFVIRKAYTTQQVFTVMGLGYHLFFPKPYDNPVNQCGGVDKIFQPNQTVYIIDDFLAKAKIKVGIPCKQYPQSYFVNFTPLARTWIGKKRNVG